jgi:murein hydrolase activator
MAAGRRTRRLRPPHPGPCLLAIALALAPGLAGADGLALVAPVRAPVLRGWGQADDAGAANGITYAAVAGAAVVSPCRGKVVFASPFRSYGQLLIVDCGGGWRVVLAGLERLDAVAGKAVRAGEPVGVMPEAASRRGGLYFELHRGGRTVNPAPYVRGGR